MCDCELRWYKKWYESEWQDIDTDYIRDPYCLDPRDQKDHKMSEVSVEDMYCVMSDERTGQPPSGAQQTVNVSLGLFPTLAFLWYRYFF